MKGETMNRYQLQAKLNGDTRTVRFEDANDIEAMFTAIARTLNNASESRIWARGYIALINLTTGELVKEMASKE